MNDLISREAAIEAVSAVCKDNRVISFINAINELPPAQLKQRWMPCSEELPKKIEPVNITWINRRPELYYIHIKDKPFTSTGIYCKGQWYWYSAECEDILKEYGDYEVNKMEKDIDVIAWQPLPEPYKEGENETTINVSDRKAQKG